MQIRLTSNTCFSMFVWAHVCRCVWGGWWEMEWDNSVHESALSLHHMDLRDPIRSSGLMWSTLPTEPSHHLNLFLSCAEKMSYRLRIPTGNRSWMNSKCTSNSYQWHAGTSQSWQCLRWASLIWKSKMFQALKLFNSEMILQAENPHYMEHFMYKLNIMHKHHL